MRPRLDFAALSCLIAGLALASCGGGSSPDSLSQYRQEANQVCRDASQQFNRILRTNPVTAHQAEDQASALVDVSQQALDNFHQITPPDELKAAYTRYLQAREKVLGYIQDARDAAAKNDGAAYARAKRRTAASEPARRQLAIAAGLRQCSVPNLSPAAAG